jgi:ABC-type transporter Mla subunit MlaD
MNEKTVRQNFWVGLFALVIIGMVAALVVFFVGRSQPFEEEFRLNVRFKNAQGIKNGSPVNLQGLPMGSVETIGVEEDPETNKPVLVAKLKLRYDRSALEQITHGSTFAIATENIFGDRRIDISFGDPGKPKVKNGDTVNGVEQADINQVFQQIQAFAAKLNNEFSLLKLAAEFQKITAKQEKDLNDVKEAMKKLAELQSQMKDSPMSPDQIRAYTELAQASASLREASERMTQAAARSAESEEELKTLLRALAESLTRLQRAMSEPPK